MLIDKTKGTWCDSSTLLDDIAYKLYVDMVLEITHKYNQPYIIFEQSDIIYSHINHDAYSGYYNNAKIILRREKIEKIKRNI